LAVIRKSQPSVRAARRHMIMRSRKISKYSITVERVGVELQLQGDRRRLGVHAQERVVTASLTRSWMSMAVSAPGTHAAAVHVGLVGEDHRRADGADRGLPYCSSWLPTAESTSPIR
jgi:hypothetical protein